MNFEFKTLLEIPLSKSTCENGKILQKIARIQRGFLVKKQKEFDPNYHINILEFRTVLDGKDSIGVSLNSYDFEWLTKCLKLKKEFSAHASKRLLIFCDIGDSSVSLSSVDYDRVFGVILSSLDLDIIAKNKDIFGFLLKNQNISGSNLKDVTIDLFISVMAKEIKKEISRLCMGCQNPIEKHICKGYLKDILDIKSILNSPVFKAEVDGLFNPKFEQLMDLLNVKSEERLTQTQQNIPDLKSDEEILRLLITSFVDLKSEHQDFDKILDMCCPTME